MNEVTEKHDLFTFTFVRHPFERLSKNYSTLLQGFNYNNFINRLISAFEDRKIYQYVNGQKYNVTSFPDFANVVLNWAEKNKCLGPTTCWHPAQYWHIE